MRGTSSSSRRDSTAGSFASRPDGKRFLFYILTEFDETSGVYHGAPGAGSSSLLLTAETNAVFSGGYLMFVRNRNLYAQQFDEASLILSGSPMPIAEEVGTVHSMGLAPVSDSDNGVLVYQAVGKPTRQLAWFDRSGRRTGVSGEPGEYGPPRISPDGGSVLAGRIRPGTDSADIWLLRNGEAPR